MKNKKILKINSKMIFIYKIISLLLLIIILLFIVPCSNEINKLICENPNPEIPEPEKPEPEKPSIKDETDNDLVIKPDIDSVFNSIKELTFLQTKDQQEFEDIISADIFKNTYGNIKMIYPGIESTYKFEVKNNSKTDYKYKLMFEEDNEKNININFKLKKNGKYVAGSKNKYVDINELQKKYNIIKKNSVDNYELFWKWEDSHNDTQIGKEVVENKYILKIIGTN